MPFDQRSLIHREAWFPGCDGQTNIRTSQLIERIGLRADSLKIESKYNCILQKISAPADLVALAALPLQLLQDGLCVVGRGSPGHEPQDLRLGGAGGGDGPPELEPLQSRELVTLLVVGPHLQYSTAYSTVQYSTVQYSTSNFSGVSSRYSSWVLVTIRSSVMLQGENQQVWWQ